MQGESRENLSPCFRKRGSISHKRCCDDNALETWYAAVFPGFIEQCRDLIISEAGTEHVDGLILSGSFASCEGSVVMLAGGPVFLSDIDLLLVVSSQTAHSAIYPRRSKIAKACEDLLPGASFEGRVDVGVMTIAELAEMAFSPGVYDMREMGVILHGADELLERFPSAGPGEIGAAEVLRLLENRMAAFLGARPVTDRPEGIDLYRFLYAVSRVYTDIVTASLCVFGMYRSGYCARSDFVAVSPEASEVRRELGESLAEDIVRWTGFKTDPVADVVWKDEERAGKIWLEAVGDLLAVRDRISRNAHGNAAGIRRRPLDVWRVWKPAFPEIPVMGRFRLLIRAWLSGLDPCGHIREESVRLTRDAVEKGTGSSVGAAPGGYPHGRTSWENAASRTSAEWRRMVTGREDESLG